MTDPFIGRTIGKYRLDSEIGRGGMGVVYNGHQASLNRAVAIKVLPESLAGEGDFLERFRQEAQVIAALEHDNIVRVYDVEEDGGSWFIIMELIRGQTVREVRLGGPLPIADVCAIGSAVAGALGYAHEKGIVHRDVKSGNIMITSQGRVKLMDFGIARAPDSVVKTAVGTVLGTPEYMAPEQGRFGEVSAQTDIYSLGIVLYEMATGRLPFEATDPFAVILKHVSEPVPSAKVVNPSVPDWLDSTIAKALAKMPDDRFATASELEVALQAEGGAAVAPRTEEATPTRPLRVDPSPFDDLDPTRLRTRVPLEEKVPTTVVEKREETVPASSLPQGAGEAHSDSGKAHSGAGKAPSNTPPPPLEVPSEADRGTVPSLGLSIPGVASSPGEDKRRRQRSLIAGLLSLVGLVLLVWIFWPSRGPERPQGVGIPVAAPVEVASEEEAPAEAILEAADEAVSEDEDSGALGDEAHAVRLAFLLSEANRHLADGNTLEAIRLCDLILESEPEHEGALELLARIHADAQSSTAQLAEDSKPREPPKAVEPEAREVVIEPEPPQVTVPESAPEPKPTVVPVDPKQRARELWSEARLLKEREHYNSLESHLDQILELDSGHAEARKWAKRVERWQRSIDEDLHDDLDEWLDGLEEGIEDEDLDDLEELWRGRLDGSTESWLDDLWADGGSLNVAIGPTSTSVRDATVDFTVEITVRRKKRVIEEFTWNGRLERRNGKARFTSPLR